MRPWYQIEGFIAVPLLFFVAGWLYILTGKRKGFVWLVVAQGCWVAFELAQRLGYFVVANAVVATVYTLAYAYWPRVWRAVD